MSSSCRYLEEKEREFSKQEGLTMAEIVETLGVDLKTQTKQLGAKEKTRRKKCNVRFSFIKKNRIFQKKLFESRSVKAVKDWLCSCESALRVFHHGHLTDSAH